MGYSPQGRKESGTTEQPYLLTYYSFLKIFFPSDARLVRIDNFARTKHLTLIFQKSLIIIYTCPPPRECASLDFVSLCMCDSARWYYVLPFGWVAPFLILSIQFLWFTSQVFQNYFPNCLFIHSTIITRPWEYSCKHDGWGLCSHREGLYTNICEQIITERERAKKKISVMGLHAIGGLHRRVQKAHSEQLLFEWWEVSHARIWGWIFPGGSGDTGDADSIPESGRSLEGRHGNPLQYSCLENPMDRGAWQVLVLGAANCQTWLSNWAWASQLKERARIKAVGQDYVWQVKGPERMTTIGRVVKVIGNKVKR